MLYDDLVAGFPNSLLVWLTGIESKYGGLRLKTKDFHILYKNSKSKKAASSFGVSTHAKLQFYQGKGQCAGQAKNGNWTVANMEFAAKEIDWEEEAQWGFFPLPSSCAASPSQTLEDEDASWSLEDENASQSVEAAAEIVEVEAAQGSTLQAQLLTKPSGGDNFQSAPLTVITEPRNASSPIPSHDTIAVPAKPSSELT